MSLTWLRIYDEVSQKDRALLRGAFIQGASMKIIKIFIVLLIVFPYPAYSDLDTDYFKIGEWKLGEKRKYLLSEESPFKNYQELVKNKEYNAVVDSIFKTKVPVKLFFKGKKLHRLELTLYEGPNYEDANAASKLIISKIEKHFQGALLEGLTTSEGLKPEIFDVVVGQLLEKSKSAISEINTEDENGNEAYFNLFISLSTEYQSKGNFIYGKFSYYGDRDIYNVTVFEDKKFNSNHVAPTTIHIGSMKNANKVTK